MKQATPLSSFLASNSLRQSEVAGYLGISRPYMSQLVSGTARMSAAKRMMLLDNDRGWDASALRGEPEAESAESPEVAVLRERVRFLEEMLGEKERLIGVLMRGFGVTEGGAPAGRSVPPVSPDNENDT